MKNVILLYSEENFVWTSMQEIIPHIKDIWTSYCEQNNHQLKVINVDQCRPSDYLKDLMTSELIVISCFNASIAGWMKIIRQELLINTRWAFYLHNQATIGLWPLYELEVAQLFKDKDVFIGTCEGDLKSMDLCFKNARTKLLPFSSKNINSLPQELSMKKAQDIIFIGRLSRQKNLESLIESMSELILINPTVKLHFYGKEDFLGWPNMGLKKEESYLKELTELVSKKNLENDIIFHGFVPREVIKETWRGNAFVFCSPSLHSDENFGMAALMALEMGGRAVLSDWGGHQNYLAHLKDVCFGVTVYVNESRGLHTKVSDLSRALLRALKQDEILERRSNFFSHDEAVSNLARLEDEKNTGYDLKLTDFGSKLIAQRRKYKNKGQVQKVFTSESDPVAIELFYCYGAIEEK